MSPNFTVLFYEVHNLVLLILTFVDWAWVGPNTETLDLTLSFCLSHGCGLILIFPLFNAVVTYLDCRSFWEKEEPGTQ